MDHTWNLERDRIEVEPTADGWRQYELGNTAHTSSRPRSSVMNATPMAAAAAARAQNVRQRADRPSQRRSGEPTGSRAAVRAPLSGVEVREASDGGTLEFLGHASVYETAYEMYDMFGPYTEIVTAGAGTDSLARGDLDVPLVLGHDQLRRLARTTTGTLILTEDGNGLRVHAPALDPADYDVAYIAPKLRSGLIDEMSFAFRIESLAS